MPLPPLACDSFLAELVCLSRVITHTQTHTAACDGSSKTKLRSYDIECKTQQLSHKCGALINSPPLMCNKQTVSSEERSHVKKTAMLLADKISMCHQTGQDFSEATHLTAYVIYSLEQLIAHFIWNGKTFIFSHFFAFIDC